MRADGDGAAPLPWSTRKAVAFTVLVAGVYLANGREIGAGDTLSTALVAVSVIRGDGIYLDRFRSQIATQAQPVYYVSESRGHLVSTYPVATGFLAVPLVLPQVLVLDVVRPGWEARAFPFVRAFAKIAAAFLMAVTVLLLVRLLQAVELGAVAVPAALAAGLGSDLWTVGSQSLWQHGTAALALVSLALVLAPRERSRVRLMLAGLAAALLASIRLIDVVFAAAALIYVVVAERRRALWFLPCPVLFGALLLGYNYAYFGSLVGGEVRLEPLHPLLHGVTGNWSGNVLAGLAGTLVSPSHGLLVFSPWVVPAIAGAWLGRRTVFARAPVIAWLVASLVPLLVMLSKYSVWWGGYTYGPRYWTEAMPLFAVLLAVVLDYARAAAGPWRAALAASIAVAVALQLVGAFCFPSSWYSWPTRIDLDHGRLWDVRDTEVSRALIERIWGARPPR